MQNLVVYNILTSENQVHIQKGSSTIYVVSTIEKSINLKTLYERMEVSFDDEYVFAPGLQKKDDVRNDSDRIFNNVFDFMNRLLYEVNAKLKEIRERSDSSTFK